MCLALGATAWAAKNDSSTALADAASFEEFDTVRQMVADGADVNTPQVDGTTALHWAAHFDNLDLVKALLAAGANPEVSNRYGITPLAEAATNGDAEMIGVLLEAGADPNRPHTEGETPLMTAARTGKREAIQVLLDHGADVNMAEEWRGQTALMWAAAEGHTQAIRMLLDAGARINQKSKAFDFTGLRPKPGSVGMNFPRGGFTALLFAARQGQMDAVKTLVAEGANLNLADPDGTTPLLISVINYHYDVAGYLLEAGADPNAADSMGRTPLYAAVDMRNMDVTTRPSPYLEEKLDPMALAKLLLEAGASPDASLIKVIPPRGVLDGADSSMGAGSTPFLRAARSSDLPMMQLLVEHGANPRAATQQGVNGLMLAAGHAWRDGKTVGNPEDSVKAVRWFVEQGIDVNAQTTNQDRAIHGAAQRGNEDVIQTLADLGAEINPIDSKGRTPIDVAMGIGAGTGGVKAPLLDAVAKLKSLGGVSGQTDDAALEPYIPAIKSAN